MGLRHTAGLAFLVFWGCAGAPPTQPTAVPPPPAEAPPAFPAEVAPAAPAPPERQPVTERPSRQPEQPPPKPPAATRPAVSTPPGAFPCPPADPVSPRKHWLNAVNSLQVGDAAGAKQELHLALCQDPDNRTAVSLMEQIDQPPEALFGAQWSEYTVQSGDTLSKIAERFLGDPLLFYGVARYNRIENPSRLKVGDTVRVPTSRVAPVPGRPTPAPTPTLPPPPREPERPVDRTAPNVRASPGGGAYPGTVTVTLTATDDTDPRPVIRYTLDGKAPGEGSPVYESPIPLTGKVTVRFLALDSAGNASPVLSESYEVAAVDPYGEVREQMARGEYEAAIGRLEATLAQGGGDAQARALLVSACTQHASALAEQAKWTEAQAVLQKAAAASPDDPGLRARLQELERRVGVEQIYQNGLRAAEGGDPERALSDFQKVLELDPNHGPARQKAAEAKQDLVQVYGKRALAAFRRQELDEAIGHWDRVLALDPDDELAKLRRAEAVDLKARFEQKFETKPAQ